MEIGVRVLLCLRMPKRREPFSRNCTLIPISLHQEEVL